MTESRLLVTYASRCGATAGVAEAIGATLAENNFQVEVRPVQEVEEIAQYQAVVAGSAINGGAWLPEALQFVQAHQAELRSRPFAAFLVCMTLAMKNGEQYRSHVSSWLEPARVMVKPASEGLFAGALDIARIPSFSDRLKFKLSVLSGVWKEGDQRDWEAIRAWSENLAALLTSKSSSSRVGSIP